MALIVSALTLPVLLWLVAAIASFRRMPVLIAEGRLIVRTGRLRCLEVPLGQIAGIKSNWSSEDLKAGGVASFALIAYPNLLIDLREALPGRRGSVQAIAHKLDDPAAFATALAEALHGIAAPVQRYAST